ncbi:MAG TPA: radical SAM protein [Armatimonadota bacterium]|nr:radical SAM protein [Armatimonadota bacterium]
MTRLLTRDELLASEIGTIRKDHGGKLRVALLYPNTYAVGMSNLGFQTLYRLFNARNDVVCERAFLPEQDQATNGILRTMESNTPLAEMDIIAFSISFELDYPNIPRLLRLGGVEPFSKKREAPLVLAGGATVSYNPEPIAPFIDIAVIGEAEEVLTPLLDALQTAYDVGTLDPLTEIPGIYLPGRGTPPTARLAVRDINAVPVYNQIFTDNTEFGHMALVEVSRGCPYGCLFCVASHVYRPARWRSQDTLMPVIERGLQYRKRVGLIGASVTDHPQIERICEEILARGGQPSPASMRADALTDNLLALLAQGGVNSITLAPEAALEPLRKKVGKRFSDESLFAAATRAKQVGINHIKLYFIVGLPGETDDDVAAIPELVLRLIKQTGMRVSIGCSAFVPKPGTPFARQPMAPERDVKRKFDIISHTLHGQAAFTHESARWAYWQAVLARGGRELADVLAAIAMGKDTPGAWASAFREHDIDADQYALRTIPKEEPVPWAHIGVKGCL